MIYFTLPNFYEALNVNKFLYELNKTHAHFFKEQISFYMVSGAFPFSSWNGGINCNVGEGAYYNDFINVQNNSQLHLPLRLNMANVLLESTDYYDHMNAAILSIFNDGSTMLEISSIPLMEYIKNKYSEYNFMLSSQADLITKFTPELLNDLNEFDTFSLIGLPTYLNTNFDFLKQLKSKSKYEIIVNPICNSTCMNYNDCWLNEHKNQLNYSEKQYILNCMKTNQFLDANKILSLEEIKKTYLPLGFNKFTFSTQYLLSENKLLNFYLQYFIKPEYRLAAYDEWNKIRRL